MNVLSSIALGVITSIVYAVYVQPRVEALLIDNENTSDATAMPGALSDEQQVI